MKKIVFLFISILLFTGCYDYIEVDDINIVNGIYIDYKDGMYLLVLEIVESDKDGKEVKSNFIKDSSESLEECFNNLKNNSKKDLYLGNISVLVLSRSIARMGIIDTVDVIIRDVSINNNYIMIVSEDMNDIFNIENENISSNLLSIIKSSYGNVNDFMVEKVCSMIINKTKSISLPYIYLEDDSIKVDYMAYFKEDKYVSNVIAKYYKLFNNKDLEYLIKDEDIESTLYKCKIRYIVDKDIIKIIIDSKGVINKVKGYNLGNSLSYDILENKVSDILKKEVIDYINVDTRIIGLNYKYYAKYGVYPDNIKYEVISNVSLNRNGSIIGDLNE